MQPRQRKLEPYSIPLQATIPLARARLFAAPATQQQEPAIVQNTNITAMDAPLVKTSRFNPLKKIP